jgi:dynein heavy chain
MVVLVR